MTAQKLAREGTLLFTKRFAHTLPVQQRVIRFVHLGIVSIEGGRQYVYDLHPENSNEKRGNLSKKPIEDYMKDKKLIGIYHTGASTSRIREVSKRCWAEQYSNYSFNCQRFINEVTYGKFNSDLYSYYAGIIIPVALVATGLLFGIISLLKSNK